MKEPRMIPTSQETDRTTTARTSTLDRATLLRLASTEYERFTTMLQGLTAEDWARQTECPAWDAEPWRDMSSG